MVKFKIVNWLKKDPFIHSIFLLSGVIVFLILVVIVCIAIFYFSSPIIYKYIESKIDRKFRAEVSTLPQIKVKRFFLWEADSMVDLDIQNKGSVSFWYSLDGSPRIESISPYSLPFTCFYTNGQGQKIGYAFDTDLYLGKDSRYKKWFPFEVNNLHDLVDKYDAIIKVLDTFPKNPEMVDFEDSWGKRSVVKNPNPNFILKDKYNFKDVVCDLYVSQSQTQ